MQLFILTTGIMIGMMIGFVSWITPKVMSHDEAVTQQNQNIASILDYLSEHASSTPNEQVIP